MIGKILDKLEAIVGRWFYLTMFAVIIVACIIVAICEAAVEKRVYDLPNGACYCPSCGTVMVIEGKEESE